MTLRHMKLENGGKFSGVVAPCPPEAWKANALPHSSICTSKVSAPLKSLKKDKLSKKSLARATSQFEISSRLSVYDILHKAFEAG